MRPDTASELFFCSIYSESPLGLIAALRTLLCLFSSVIPDRGKEHKFAAVPNDSCAVLS